MGMSISYCANEWEKVEKKFNVPKIRQSFSYKDFGLSEELNYFEFEYPIIDLIEARGGNVVSQRTLETLEGMMEIYQNMTKEVFEELNEEVHAKKMILEMQKHYQKGDIILVDEKEMHLANGIHEEKRNIWQPRNFVEFDGYSDVMWMSLQHTDKYGCKINDALIYKEMIWEYLEGTTEGDYLDEKINRDTTHLGEEFENMINQMTNFDNDEFFDARKERFKKFLPVMKAGAKIVYL